jgi:hypothetical protein
MARYSFAAARRSTRCRIFALMECMALYPFARPKSSSRIKPGTPNIHPSTCATARSVRPCLKEPPQRLQRICHDFPLFVDALDDFLRRPGVDFHDDVWVHCFQIKHRRVNGVGFPVSRGPSSIRLKLDSTNGICLLTHHADGWRALSHDCSRGGVKAWREAASDQDASCRIAYQ